MDPGVRTMRAEALSASLTLNTWRSVAQTYRKILQCRSQLSLALSFPWSGSDTATFASWLAGAGLSPGSVRSHCSKLSTIHELLDLQFHRPPHLTRTLIGLRNANILSQQKARKKAPMTVELMVELRANISARKWPMKLKRLLWLCYTWCWAGCLRIGELLPPSRSQFIIEQTPRVCDVRLESKLIEGQETRAVMLDLRCSKTNKDKVVIELSEDTANKRLCPVAAFLKARPFLVTVPEQPIFSLSEDTFLCPALTNDVLRICLPSCNWSEEFVVNHSLRSGLPTVMAQRGFSDDAIAIQGRWTSEAWRTYARKNRSTNPEDRAMLSRTLSDILNACKE